MQASKDITTANGQQAGCAAGMRGAIENARLQAVRSVDSCRVQLYWQMGKSIF